VNIPNPNHFAISGSAGGPIGVINNKTLANSDFMTGAFPAEYGNSIAGVFDLKFRNGNNEKHEFSGQFGLFGTEIMAEGPINKEKRSSYLLAYRYSTLSIFSFLGLDLGTSAVPRYQDINFKLNFPQKNGANLSVFGLAGKSDIEILISNQKKPEKEIYGEQDRDQYFGTAMGTVGASYTKSLNQTTYMKFTMAASLEEQHSHHDLVFRHVNADGFFKVDSFLAKQDYRFLQQKTSAYFFVNKKLNVKHHIKTGLDADMFFMNFEDSARLGYTTIFHQRWNYNGNALLLQPYIQWKYKISDNLVLNTGLHSQYFTLNNSYSLIEPRLGLKWQFEETQTLSFGTGLHSQIQPTYTYFYQIPDFFGNYQMINQQMGMTKSMHYVIGYDKFFGQNLRFKAETYYQHLFDVPVEKRNSSFSMVNQGSGFSRLFPDSLQNTGTADNYGIEFTLEKFFSRKYFFMLTTSFYESNYKGSDGVLRNTDFNGRYIVNFLFSREFKIGNNKTLALGTKITRAGNKWYSPVDTSATKLADEIIYVDSMRNTIQFKDYFRVDLKINYRINTNRLTHEIGLDLVNILSTQNVLKLSYVPDPANPSANPVREEYQLGFLPIFSYKIDF
jgi:hypothetical protein